MSKIALDPINLLQSASAPSGTFNTGDTYYDTTAKAIFFYNGTTWVQDANLTNAQTFTAANTIAPTSTSVIPLTINAPSGVSVDVVDVDINGTKYLWVDKFGNTFNGSLTVGTATALGARLGLYTNGPTVVGEIIKCASLQTSDLLQTQNSSGTIISGINAAGQIYAGTTVSSVGGISTAISLTSAAYTSATVAVFTYSGTSLLQVGQKVTISGVTGGAYNGIWTVSAVTTTTFTVLGSGFTNNAGTGGKAQISASISAVAGTAAITPLIVVGATSQTANLQEWQNPAGTVLVAVGANGTIATGSTSGAPTVASATTIAPTTAIAFVSGTTAIATITAPAPISTNGGSITLIPTGAFTTTTAGNIALASTATVSKAMIMTYDPVTVKWYPSY